MKELLKNVLRRKMVLVIEEDVLAKALEIAKNNGVNCLAIKYDYCTNGKLWCLEGYIVRSQYFDIVNDLEDGKIKSILLSRHGFRNIG